MKRHLHHLHPRRPLFWILAALTVAIVIWAFWPQALAAMIASGVQAPG